VAAVLFGGSDRPASPVAAVALVFSLALVTVSMPSGSQLLSNDNAYVIPVLVVLSYSAGAWLDTRRSVGALGIALARLSVGRA